MTWIAAIPVVLVVGSLFLFFVLNRKRHRHDWRATDAVFTPPVEREIKAVATSTLERVAYGFTTVYWTCKCGRFKTTDYVGDQREAFK